MGKYSEIKNLEISFPAPKVLLVQFNKPHKINAVNSDTWREYGKVFETAAKDPNVNAIVLAGKGHKGFCAGLDLKDEKGFQEISGEGPDSSQKVDVSRRAIYTRNTIREFQRAIKASYDCPKPVIGIAHGVSFGLAIDVLSNVDIRYAVSDVQFSVREIIIGMAADIGSLQQLPRIVGNQSWVRDIVYTGRIFNADEALKQGFVSEVFATLDEALEHSIKLAKQMADYSPVALQGAKESLNYAMEHSLDEGLDQIANYNAYALQHDFMVGIKGTLAKKKPTYSKL